MNCELYINIRAQVSLVSIGSHIFCYYLFTLLHRVYQGLKFDENVMHSIGTAQMCTHTKIPLFTRIY